MSGGKLNSLSINATHAAKADFESFFVIPHLFKQFLRIFSETRFVFLGTRWLCGMGSLTEERQISRDPIRALKRLKKPWLYEIRITRNNTAGPWRS